jgi:hypothetical protein
MSIRVQHATLQDFPWILEQLEDLDEWYFGSRDVKKRFFVDKEHISWSLSSMLEDGIILLAWRGEQRIGYIAGWVTSHPYNPDIKLATHASWFVDEEHRNTKAAIQLMMVFKSTAQALGCDWVVMSLAPETPIREESMKRWGFVPKDRSYLLEI